IFERTDFEDLLNGGSQPAVSSEKKAGILSSTEAPLAIPSAAVGPPPDAWGTHAEPAYDVEKLKPKPIVAASASKPGIYLSHARATFLIVAMAVALALAFVTGLLIASFVWPGYGNRPTPGETHAPAPRQALAFRGTWTVDEVPRR